MTTPSLTAQPARERPSRLHSSPFMSSKPRTNHCYHNHRTWFPVHISYNKKVVCHNFHHAYRVWWQLPWMMGMVWIFQLRVLQYCLYSCFAMCVWEDYFYQAYKCLHEVLHIFIVPTGKHLNLVHVCLHIYKLLPRSTQHVNIENHVNSRVGETVKSR